MSAAKERRPPVARIPRRTRICATIGPASGEPETLRALVEAGVDIVRLNFSHGDLETHAKVARRVHAAARGVDRPIAVMADLQGPRIRIGRLREAQEVEAGDEVLLGPGGLPVTFASLPDAVSARQRVLLKDGSIRLRVTAVERGAVRCAVERGGRITSGAGMNLPDSSLDLPGLTARDRRHLQAAAEMGVDAVALSFVRDADDIEAARRILRRLGSGAHVVAKIERAEALVNLDAIVAAADGVLVARGDLGVECGLEQVPLLQKDLIRRAVRARTFVITATQMLESMITAPAPTRAEASDVATAVFDGADAVMLSAETAAGQYPFEAVNIMDRIIARVEEDSGWRAMIEASRPAPEHSAADAIAAAARQVAHTIDAAVICAFTASGSTALRAARERPEAPVLGLTTSMHTARRLAVVWGVHAVLTPEVHSMTETVAKSTRISAQEGFAVAGNPVIVIAGVPFGQPGTTNALRVALVR